MPPPGSVNRPFIRFIDKGHRLSGGGGGGVGFGGRGGGFVGGSRFDFLC